jgi:P pilus assembly chaperone PapD
MNYKHKNFLKILMMGLAIIFVSAFILPVVTAEAKVMVFPRRIIFEDDNRSATIRLVNTVDEQITYRIIFIQSRMTEEGNIERIAAPEQQKDRLDEMMAQNLIRYSPRQVTLPPGEIQLVRLQLNKPAGLEEGEYRSRLLFQEIPENVEFEGDDSANNGGFSIELRAIYGISLPIFVRHGDLSADVKISDVQLSKNEGTDLLPEIFLTINRSGSSSTYGNIEVKYIPGEGRARILGRIRGAAVYTDVEERNLRLSLPGAQDIELNEGKIYISYSRPEEEGGGILAETELEL